MLGQAGSVHVGGGGVISPCKKYISTHAEFSMQYLAIIMLFKHSADNKLKNYLLNIYFACNHAEGATTSVPEQN
jgi:hypothetical protein